MTATAAAVAASLAAAQTTATLTLTVPPVFKTKFIKSGKKKGLAKKAFTWTVAGSDSNAGALLDVFVRPTTTPCAPNANTEGTATTAGGNGGQALIPEMAVSGSFTFTHKLRPVKGPSTFCAYVHTGNPSTTPDKAATAMFVAKKKSG
ncbi:MAG TPA: hypothetical protein VGY97_08285 [Solirubrobacteraceae bacterium]|nr:hypothetical protein [Solirubrobacteraceae bacterium]